VCARLVIVCTYACILRGFVYQRPLAGSIRKTRARQDLLQPLASDCVTLNTRTRMNTHDDVTNTGTRVDKRLSSRFESLTSYKMSERDERTRDPWETRFLALPRCCANVFFLLILSDLAIQFGLNLGKTESIALVLIFRLFYIFSSIFPRVTSIGRLRKSALTWVLRTCLQVQQPLEMQVINNIKQ